MDLRRSALIVWAAMCIGLAIFFAVALLVRLPPRTDILRPMLAIAAGLTVFSLVTARILPEWLKRPPKLTREQFAMQRHTIACALCQGAALFACVVLMITRSPLAGAIAAVGYGGLLVSYPGQERWQRLLGPAGVDEPEGPSRVG